MREGRVREGREEVRKKRGERVCEGRESTWDGTGREGKVKENLEEEDGKGGGYSPQTSISGAVTVYRCFPKQLQTGDNNFRNGTAERTVIGQLME